MSTAWLLFMLKNILATVVYLMLGYAYVDENIHGGCDDVLGVEVLTWIMYLLVENILVSDMSSSIEVFRYIHELEAVLSLARTSRRQLWCIRCKAMLRCSTMILLCSGILVPLTQPTLRSSGVATKS